ncbi:class I adenylate-forming enzyme family protein [Amycolatopsis sp. 195334CR]|uniref:class I adenylate-forming enzyme family protein n=1 Tax=Amycolatopsis sp. 195334CR TaxID=2814588 RepID=UPI001A8CB9A9|nr:class I adenylate-forming enzyme family protein [Amycolatopsis sp. 195334CR]MBN6037812.1 acyl--CoA ligase [Amycolatopsis sp. 195334CR]
MRPYDMGVLFDECADRGYATRVRLDRPFDIAPDGGIDYGAGELAALVAEVSGWLAAAGTRAGDRVAVLKPNHWDYDLIACAAIRLGAVPAQLSAHLPPEWLAELLRRLKPAVLVTTAEHAALGVAFASRVITLDTPEPGAIHVDRVRGHRPPPPRRPDEHAPLVINHTSGTTGLPKLVVHSTSTIVRKLAGLEAVRLPAVGIRRDDTVANASSYAHGRTFCWTAGVFCRAPARIVILSGQHPDAADVLLRRYPPTFVEALPAAFARFRPLLSRLDNPFRDVRVFLSTYDAMHPPVVRDYLHASRRRRPLWIQGWGQTETGPITVRFLTRKSLAVRRERQPATRDLGRAIPLRTRLKVVDPGTFEPLPRGRAGLALTRTPARCLGYVGENQRWQEKHDAGWWNTGDLAVHRRDGRVLLLDREVDTTPGLSCLELEDVLEDRLPGVLECLVLAMPGKDPLPVVVTETGRVDAAEWTGAVHDLPELQPPRVLTWEEIPRTGTGQVRRLALLTMLTGCAETPGTGRWT